MRVIKSWAMRWDDILRDVLFPDEELATQMMIPANTKILTWIDKYFVDATICTDIVTDENVRVLWWEEQPQKTNNPFVNKRRLCFDIYVKTEHIKDATNDMLQSRARLICQKIHEILTFPDTVGRVMFAYVDDYDIGTKMVGYVRHRLVVSYLASHK